MAGQSIDQRNSGGRGGLCSRSRLRGLLRHSQGEKFHWGHPGHWHLVPNNHQVPRRDRALQEPACPPAASRQARPAMGMGWGGEGGEGGGPRLAPPSPTAAPALPSATGVSGRAGPKPASSDPQTSCPRRPLGPRYQPRFGCCPGFPWTRGPLSPPRTKPPLFRS